MPRRRSRPGDPALQLSRRERQIMDVVFRQGEVTVAEVLEGIPNPPSYSAVRALLRVLEEKGYLKHRQDGPRYLYSATIPHEQASASALRRLVGTFFDGSVEKTVAALLDLESEKLSGEELERLERIVEQARERGS